MKKNLLLIVLTSVVISGAWMFYMILNKANNHVNTNPDYTNCSDLEEKYKLQLEQAGDRISELKSSKKELDKYLILIDELTQYRINEYLFIGDFLKYAFDETAKNSAEIVFHLAHAFNPNIWNRSDQQKHVSSYDGNKMLMHQVNTHSTFANLLSKARRDTIFIKHVFSEPIINYLASNFAVSNAFNNGGKQLMDALYYAYHEVKNKPRLLEQLYQDALTHNTLTNERYNDMASDSVKKLLLADHHINGQNEYDDMVDPISKYALVYGFWARRHHEKNMEVVFGILEEFKNEVDNFDEFE